MRKRRSTAVFNANAYKKEFADQHYDRVYLYLPKGQKAVFLGRAKKYKLSLNSFVGAILNHYLHNEGLEFQAVEAVEARGC